MFMYIGNYYVKQIFELYESQYEYRGSLFSHFVSYKMKIYH
jgi:hypothetical protein